MMYSCGLYDYSGEFAFKIGVPAKSGKLFYLNIKGVGGGILVIVPGLCGITTFSPRLDKIGNSVRGLDFCNQITQIYNFHIYDRLSDHYHSEEKLDPKLLLNSRIHEKHHEVFLACCTGDLAHLKFLKSA